MTITLNDICFKSQKTELLVRGCLGAFTSNFFLLLSHWFSLRSCWHSWVKSQLQPRSSQQRP